MQTKLFLIEGLPGSGKTTIAKCLYEYLIELGIEAALFCEGDLDHPADFEGVAYLNESQFLQLKQLNLGIDLMEKGVEDGFLVPYMKLSQVLTQAQLEDLRKVDIYELPLAKNRALILNKWRTFAKETEQKNQVVIFECCFMQNPITVSMVRDNASDDETLNYVKSLEETVKDLQPVLIYLTQNNIENTFEKVSLERGQNWLEAVTEYYTKRGYGQAKKLQRSTGVIEVLKARTVLEKQIYQTLNIQKFIVETNDLSKGKLKEILASIILETMHCELS